jgi:23S rRNA pseudouridine1911/1915/1917 synthase
LTLRLHVLSLKREDFLSLLFINREITIGQVMEMLKIIQPNSTFSFTVGDQDAQLRLDVYLCKQFPHHSRSFMQKLLEKELVTIDGKKVQKSNILVKKEAHITVHFPELKRSQFLECRDVGARILYEHDHFFIVYKPPFLNVHAPEHECTEATLVDWLITRMPELATVGCDDRPGIVHRLDKETSGLLIVAKNNYAHAIFGDMFRDRQMSKTYYALVQGNPPAEGTIGFPIGRHQVSRQKMTHYPFGHAVARDALTHYKVVEYFNEHALLEVKPVTGRTHQIRVHCAAIGHPIIGDMVYGSKSKFIKRQALHAASISFMYEGQPFTFSVELPEDFTQLLDVVRSRQK